MDDIDRFLYEDLNDTGDITSEAILGDEEKERRSTQSIGRVFNLLISLLLLFLPIHEILSF